MTSRAPFLRRLVASLLSGLVVAAVTQAALVLLFFATTGAVNDQLMVVNDFFLTATAFVFVLSSVAALLGAYARWYIALAASIVLGVIAALAGTVIPFASAGNELTPETWPLVFQTLGGNNLYVPVFVALATVTAGRAVYKRVVDWNDAPVIGERNLALVRLPSSTFADGELTHLERTPVDLALADTQWENYVAVLEAYGFTTVEVEAADTHPDSVFIEDTVVILDGTAVITSPGAESRRGEITAVETAVESLGLDVARIELPGTLDGGDVLKVGTTVYVGRGGRTNADGIRQFRSIANDLGFTVVAVPVSRVLHLKSAVTALPDGTVIGYAPLVEHPELFERFLAVPEESGSAVVVLADDTVLMASSAPASAALIEDLGYRVITVDVSEFEKLEGCVTCLSVRIR